MRSRWCELKDNAIRLRKQGLSIGKIERKLGIPRSTLSGWFKYIKLSQEQKNNILNNWKKELIKARKKAALWHNAQKLQRLEKAKTQAARVVNNLNINDINIIELSLAFLYLGEGSRKTEVTALASSDPLLLKFFLAGLKSVYNIDVKKIKCELSLRADQDCNKVKRFWSRTLKLPLSSFGYIRIDKRTIGYKTYPYYKGVCCLRYADIGIQRRLVNLGLLFCEKIIVRYL